MWLQMVSWFSANHLFVSSLDHKGLSSRAGCSCSCSPSLIRIVSSDPDPPLLLTIGKQSELEGISCCLPPGLDNPPSAINILSPTLTHVWRECKLEKTFDMLLQFSGHFNPWLLPGRFPSMALTSPPCPDIALIVSWHTRHCVPHCDQTPFRIVRTEQQMLQAFSKEPTHWPAAASQSARESKKREKNLLLGGFVPFKVCTLAGADSHVPELESSTLSTRSAVFHQDCQEHPPRYQPSVIRFAPREKKWKMWKSLPPAPFHFLQINKWFSACQNHSEVLKHILQKGWGDIWKRP